MNQLVSGQLDADRMDYLLRDAYFTGTSYGKFDLERILRSFSVYVKNGRIVGKNKLGYIAADYIMSPLPYVLASVSASGGTQLWNPAFYLFRRMKKECMLHPWISWIDVKCSSIPLWCGCGHWYVVSSGRNPQPCMDFSEPLVTCRDEMHRDISYRLLNRKLFEYVTLKNPEEFRAYSTACTGIEGYDPDYYVFIRMLSHKSRILLIKQWKRT